MKIALTSVLVLVICCLQPASAWDQIDLEIFDLVEEVKSQNFYTLMGINQVLN
jgi:hypothetical protein